MVQYLAPDYDDPWEWSLARALARWLAQVNSPEGLFMVLLVIGVFLSLVLLKLIILVLRRLWDIYKTRAGDTTTSGKTLKWSGISLLVLTVLLLMLASQPGMEGTAFLVFAVSLFLFTILSEVVNYYQARQEAAERPALPENISIQDVITWKNELAAAPVIVPVS